MASTYSSNLGLEIQATGENSATWGDKTNTNLELLEDAISDVGAITHDNSADYTLSDNNGSVDQSRSMVLEVSGALTAARNLVVPTNDKLYVVKNGTTGGYAITVKTSGGTGISIANGRKELVYCDGTNVESAIDKLGGLTATVTELNLLDGVTSTTAELNILDGVTATTAELNIMDGVTATTAELNILDGVTSTAAELNILDGVTATAAELNALDGITATATELNHTDGVTSAIQTQLDGKLPLAGGALTGPVTTNSTFDGRNVGTDGDKLDVIEAGATADQTNTEIKTAYEANVNTNEFSDAEQTKLSGIEANADVTDTTNVVASLTAGTNVAISAGGTISSTDTDTTYSVGDGGLTQNNFTTTLKSKLDGIESDANNYTHPSEDHLPSTVSQTEAGYLDGVTSAIQDQLDGKQATIANDGLSGDKIDGGTISNFASTGIDDNATSTAITIDASGNATFVNSKYLSDEGTSGQVLTSNGAGNAPSMQDPTVLLASSIRADKDFGINLL